MSDLPPMGWPAQPDGRAGGRPNTQAPMQMAPHHIMMAAAQHSQQAQAFQAQAMAQVAHAAQGALAAHSVQASAMQVQMPHPAGQAPQMIIMQQPQVPTSAGQAGSEPELPPDEAMLEQQEQEKLAQTFSASLRQLGIRYAQEIWAIHIATSHLEQLEREALSSRAEHAAVTEKVKENDRLIQEMKQQVEQLRSIDWVEMKKTIENK